MGRKWPGKKIADRTKRIFGRLRKSDARYMLSKENRARWMALIDETFDHPDQEILPPGRADGVKRFLEKMAAK